MFHDPDYDPQHAVNGLEEGVDPVDSPGSFRSLSDPFRAWLDAYRAMATLPALSLYPRGDNLPVLVLPGLGGSDLSTSLLRTFLRARGYDARGWKLGFNRGPASVGWYGERISARLWEIPQ